MIAKNNELSMMQAIHYWLNYQCKVCKIDLLAESSIKFPLMEYIERYIGADTCHLERQYKEILSEDIFNTTKYLDIMWEKDGTEYLVELKYVSEHTYEDRERQRYFNDLVRLSLALKYKNTNLDRRCFFLVCGDSSDFWAQMRGQYEFQDLKHAGNTFNKDIKTRKKIRKLEFSKWLLLDSRAIKQPYKMINIDKEHERFSRFCDEYFKGEDKKENAGKIKKYSKKKDKTKYKNKLDTFYTKRLWLNSQCDEKMTGLWEIMLDQQNIL